MNASAAPTELVTVSVAGQAFGIAVADVRDVLAAPAIARIPLAPAEVAGSLNLRGRIVTAIDLRQRLGLPPRGAGEPAMSVVVDHRGELYCLLVDGVGDVFRLEAAAIEANPPTLAPAWRALALGVCRLDGRLVVVLDVARTLDLAARAA